MRLSTLTAVNPHPRAQCQSVRMRGHRDDTNVRCHGPSAVFNYCQILVYIFAYLCLLEPQDIVSYAIFIGIWWGRLYSLFYAKNTEYYTTYHDMVSPYVQPITASGLYQRSLIIKGAFSNNFQNNIYTHTHMYIYIYIYMCVCVCFKQNERATEREKDRMWEDFTRLFVFPLCRHHTGCHLEFLKWKLNFDFWFIFVSNCDSVFFFFKFSLCS